MVETILYQKLKDGLVRCGICEQRCVIVKNKVGLCGTRQNIKGMLYSLVYGKAIAVHIDPIEKKPFYHFQPGSQSLSFATVGCNFHCLFCQNWDISQASKKQNFWKNHPFVGEDLLPEKIVALALKKNCQSIAYTYTEPTVFLEYALDTMKLAHKKNLKNVWVSNGFMTKESLEKIAPYLDAINIDLKSFSEKFYQKICGARLKPVLRNLKEIKAKKIWLEVTTLLIPEKNDSQKELSQIAKFIVKELGPETPWHISRFYPAYQMRKVPPTSVSKIHTALEIGRKAGLKYVYAGNVPGNDAENTYCPKCQKVVIRRVGYITRRLDKEGQCAECSEKLDLIE